MYNNTISQPGQARTKKVNNSFILTCPGCQMKTYGFQTLAQTAGQAFP
ncbi:MAG: hypothetical protein SCARUB_00988 [Candidatus Scalindua rubra]|uniref:Uncharacterized protein n=1 Tax=Candidatus Scalindua rubra TaxID=1872076 RepID=A0A1E3XDW3_9BACT|nr:MAG: hypothetical protein SCARUB_00988 [Candidatus Scalindua rubra]